MPESLQPTSNRLAILWLSLALIGAASMTIYHLGFFIPRMLAVRAANHEGNGYSFGDDFYPIWLTTREWRIEHRDLYSPEMTRQIQIGLFGRALDPQNPNDPPADYRQYAYPAFTNLLFWPAAEFPFPVVRIALVPLLVALTLASVYLWMQALSLRPGWIWLTVAGLLTLCSYPVLEGLYADQLGLFVGCALAASAWALTQRRAILSGVLMGLATVKPQMCVLIGLYFTVWTLHRWRDRRGFLLAFASTLTGLCGAAMLLWPRWIESWVRVVLGYHHYANAPILSEVFQLRRETPPAAALTATIYLAVIGPALVLLWRNRNARLGSKEFWLTTSLLLAVTTIALLPGQAVHDHVLLLPGIFLLASSWRQTASTRIQRMLLLLAAGILLWPWFAALALILVRPLLSPQTFYSRLVFALPLRTAAVFPFAVLGALLLAQLASLRQSSPPSPTAQL